MQPISNIATSCESTSTPVRARTTRWRRRPPSATKALFDELGVTGYIKTSGNRGLHVYVRLQPTHDSVAVRSAAVAVARELERRHPT